MLALIYMWRVYFAASRTLPALVSHDYLPCISILTLPNYPFPAATLAVVGISNQLSTA